MNVTGARLNVAPVVFESSEALIVADPCPTGDTVTVGMAPQLVKVTVDGLTVATDVSLELRTT